MRSIGDQVRYFTVALGWEFGTVERVERQGQGSCEFAEVRFNARKRTARHDAAPERTQLVALFLLELCGKWPE